MRQICKLFCQLLERKKTVRRKKESKKIGILKGGEVRWTGDDKKRDNGQQAKSKKTAEAKRLRRVTEH